MRVLRHTCIDLQTADRRHPTLRAHPALPYKHPCDPKSGGPLPNSEHNRLISWVVGFGACCRVNKHHRGELITLGDPITVVNVSIDVNLRVFPIGTRVDLADPNEQI